MSFDTFKQIISFLIIVKNIAPYLGIGFLIFMTFLLFLHIVPLINNSSVSLIGWVFSPASLADSLSRVASKFMILLIRAHLFKELSKCSHHTIISLLSCRWKGSKCKLTFGNPEFKSGKLRQQNCYSLLFPDLSVYYLPTLCLVIPLLLVVSEY